MASPYIGQIQAFGFNFAPSGWAICDGALQSIASNSPLFSLLGTQYGGDGESTFALPDLRGRAMVQYGTGPGLTSRNIGEKYGEDTQTLGITHLPAHSHRIRVRNGASDLEEPAGAFLGATSEVTYGGTSDGAFLNEDPNTGASESIGGGGAFENNGPRLAVTICIALFGIFPSQN